MASMPSTFIRLSGTQRNRPVYRFVSIPRLCEFFHTRQNVLVSPDKWDDPFENFVLQSKRIPRQSWFGQCWTRHRASDAMWRIYSPDSHGVRIRALPSRLLEGLTKSLQPGSRGFIGAVQYLPEKRLMRFVQAALAPGKLDDAVEVAKTLLVKRPAFRHEAEVRVLLMNPGAPSNQKLAQYPVDPHELIDQLMLDPRLSKAEFEKVKHEIRQRTGFAGTIKRSLLYAPPMIMFSGSGAMTSRRSNMK